MNADRLLALYDRVAEAPDAIAHLRRFVLNLAVRGKLVEQNPADEPASELLKRITAEKARLVKAGKIRKPKHVTPPNDFPFAIPLTWQWTHFGNIVYFSAGRTPSRNETAFWNTGDFAWVSIADMKDGKTVQTTKETVSDKARFNVFRSEPEAPGTMIMSFKLTIGKIARLNIPAFHNEAIISIRPHLNELDQFLFKVLPNLARSGDTKAAIKGATLNRKSISKILIPLPPLAEQHRIVAKVDELMALCDRLEEARIAREDTRDRLTKASLARLSAPDTDDVTFRSHACIALDVLPALSARADQVKHLRQTILNLAVRGKLVEQDPADEPASELLKRIASEKARLVKAGVIKKPSSFVPVVSVDQPFLVPVSWKWISSTYPAYGVSDLGKKVKTKDVLEGGAFPVVDQGKVLVRGYCNDARKVIKVSKPVVVFGDHTRETKLINFDFVVGADGVKILQPVCIDASFYHLALRWLPLDSRGYGRHFKLLKSSCIPLPPLAEQHRIVAKVDELMALCDRLEAGLAVAATTRCHLLASLLHEALAPIGHEAWSEG